MIRKFNYTNRKKVPRDKINISIHESNGKTHFNATLTIKDLEFPESSRVYIEPFYGPDSLRFDFGNFSSIEQPANTDITELKQLSGRVYFHIKIVDETTETGLLLGDAKIYDLTDDDSPSGRSSILHVNPVKMDSNEIWKIDFTGEMPVLEVNNSISGIFEIAKNDPIFISLVYPAAIRKILEHIAYDLVALEDDNDDWSGKWIQFTKTILGVENLPDENSMEECEEWINNVVRAFCIKHKLLENYLQKINQ